MPLVPKVRQQLKAKAHNLKPIILIGNKGLTETVNHEIDRALYDHELIKMRIHDEDRDARRTLFAEICKAHRAELVHVVGKIGIIYRKSDKDK